MNVLREWRGAVHGAAVLAQGLEPLQAVMARTPGMAGLFGWPEPFPDSEPFAAQWAEAELSTDRQVARAFAALAPGERSELVDLALAAQAAAA